MLYQRAEVDNHLLNDALGGSRQTGLSRLGNALPPHDLVSKPKGVDIPNQPVVLAVGFVQVTVGEFPVIIR